MDTRSVLRARITYIVNLLKRYGYTNIKLRKYHCDPCRNFGWYRIEAVKERVKLVITELISSERVVKYSYTAIVENRPVLRYDNAPHHRVPTYPHHKHVEDRVEPLANPSLEAFLEELHHRFVPKTP